MRVRAAAAALAGLVAAGSLLAPGSRANDEFMERWEPRPRARLDAATAPAQPDARELPRATPSNPLVFADGAAPMPRGYLAIPGTKTALRITAVLKLDAIHDTGPYSGDYSDLPNLGLRGHPGDAGGAQPGLTRLHARESGVSLGTFSDTSAGPVVAYLEMDFYGAAGANTYGLRMSQAYVSWGGLLAGHTYSSFLDVDARGTTVEYNGATGSGSRKRAQLRFTTRAFGDGFIALALENGAADYTGPDGTRVTAADTLLVQGSQVAQQLPDLTGHVRAAGRAGHLGLRAVVRQLRLRSGDAPAHELLGYGAAISGKWQPRGRNNLFAQAACGQGLGGIIEDLDGQAATFDRTGRSFVPQLGYGGLVGGEAMAGSRLRGHLIASVSGVRLAAIAPSGDGVLPLSTRFFQIIANVIYAPSADLLLGLEYAHYRRDTNTPLIGLSHRLQLGILYRFGS